MKETPIIFSTPMVQSILEGRKKMTRRVVKGISPDSKYLPEHKLHDATFLEPQEFEKPDAEKMASVINCPYGKPGDLLWVRETFKVDEVDHNLNPVSFYYLADNEESRRTGIKFKPSIHMPKAAARIWLRITDVRIERLHEINDEDAIMEGIFFHEGLQGYSTDVHGSNFHCSKPINSFCKLWVSINGPESWDSNPWVWVVSFKVISKTGNICGK